jgi:AAA family ATP:ADP antiporter
VVYGLEMLKSVKGVELQWPVLPLLEHKSSEVRRLSLEILQEHGDSSLRSEVEPLLADPELSVRREALRLICQYSEKGVTVALREYLSHTETGIQYAALSLVADDSSQELLELVDEELIKGLLLNDQQAAVEGRIQLAHALGGIGRRELEPYLENLLNDSEPTVVKVTIASLGRLKNRNHISWLVEKLADRRYRADAQDALAAYGGSIIGTLDDYFRDESIPLLVRKSLPRVISRIPEQHAVDVLTQCLKIAPSALIYDVVKGLNRLRSKQAHLNFATADLEVILIDETKIYYEVAQVEHALVATVDEESLLLLRRTLSEKRRAILERIFRLLGLIYAQRDIYNAYLGIVSGVNRRRANAVEFLDNLLRGELKRYLTPILDDPSEDAIRQRGRELYQIKIESRQAALHYLIAGRDNWLRACAVFAVRQTDSQDIRELVGKAARDRDPLVKETAQLVLSERIN